MNYIITAAGSGSRFIKKGIKPPKPLIKARGDELIFWSLRSFYFNENDNLYIVSIKNHRLKEHLKDKIEINYPKINVFWLEIDAVLNGQLLTARKAIEEFNIKGKIIIHNCDTSYKCPELISMLKEEDSNTFGIIPCFNSDGENWSFVKTDPSNKQIALEVKEKKRISNNCSVGTYVFSCSTQFYTLSEEYIKTIKSNEEVYIAPFYDYALKKGEVVKIVTAKEIKLFGTLDELMNTFKLSKFQLLEENSINGHHRNTLVVDIDGTLCGAPTKEGYLYCAPIPSVCDALRRANEKGCYIILFTSRNMRTFNGVIGLINKYTAPIIFEWLKKHNIPYDEIYFGKPWGYSVAYLDDKSLNIEDFIKTY